MKNIIHYLLFICIAPAVFSAGMAKTAPELMLANIYKIDSDVLPVQNYWVSEKLDGVRAYWNGNQFISRKGNVYNAPGWFTKALPNTSLDGELWLGRGKFEKLSGIVRRHSPQDADWRNVKFMVFDMPLLPLNFDGRLKQLSKIIHEIDVPHIQLVKQYKVKTPDQLMKKLDEVVLLGGEGLMLHLGSSFYKGQRSNDLLKLKKHQDAEARVVEHLPGKGKYQGLLGAILVETYDKKRFKIGSGFSDDERENPPRIGSIITYKYYGLTNKGLPRFASFMRIRREY